MKYLVESSVKGKQPYEVEAHDGGAWWSCTCPHWQWRLRASRGRCKHIDAVIAHNKEQEKLQEQYACQFESEGLGDWLEDTAKNKDEDLDMSPAS